MNYDLMEGRAHYPSLRGKHVFVTGGASGIGSSIVEHFCDQQAIVSFVDINETAANEVIAGIVAKGHPAPEFHKVDLRNTQALEKLIAALGTKRGPIRTLVNNAGNDDRHKLEDVTEIYFDDRMAVNLRHQLFAAKAVAPQMKNAGGGSIINFSSITWQVADGDCVCYVTSKAAIHGMTRALATELGPHKIRVNAIWPGWIMTERQVSLWLDSAGEKQLADRQALPGKLYPPDVARMALWLASDDSQMCSKQAFVVDGGWI